MNAKNGMNVLLSNYRPLPGVGASSSESRTFSTSTLVFVTVAGFIGVGMFMFLVVNTPELLRGYAAVKHGNH